jgi:hypothetical protein
VSVQDGSIATAQSAANAAQSTANTALSDAATALGTASISYAAAIASLQPSANTIVNAFNQITAIATNGITVYSGASASSGARVVMNSAGIAGFDTGGDPTFSIVASTGAASFKGKITGSDITGSTLNINGNAIIDASGYLIATGATITGSLYSSVGTIGGFTLASTYLSGAGGFTLYADGTIDGGSGNTIFYGKANLGGGTAGSETLIVTGTSNFNGTMTMTAINCVGDASVTGVFTAVDAGTVTNANTPNAWLSTDVPELDPRKLLDFKVRAFSYKLDYLNNDDRAGILIPGLIAEEVDEVYPLCADYENGEIENINDRAILINLLALVQDQDKRINILEGI